MTDAQRIAAIRARLDTGLSFKTKCEEDGEWLLDLVEKLQQKPAVYEQEIERLDRARTQDDVTFVDLQAENARLRKALEEIAGCKVSPLNTAAQEIIDIARSALSS